MSFPYSCNVSSAACKGGIFHNVTYILADEEGWKNITREWISL